MFYFKLAKLNEAVSKFSEQDQQTFKKTKQFMDDTIAKYRQIGMISLIQMNKGLLDQLRQIEPVNSERLLNLFGFSVGEDGMLAKSSSAPSQFDICSSFKQFQEIQNSMSQEGKSIVEDLSCGLQKTIKKELMNDPRMLAGVFNREFIDLVMRKKDDLKPFARYLKDMF
jgi:hypothetical protein